MSLLFYAIAPSDFHSMFHLFHLPLNDQNIILMSKFQWEMFVVDRIRNYVFDYLTVHCKNNDKTRHLSYTRLSPVSCLINLETYITRMIFRARLRMYDIKVILKRNMVRTHYVQFAQNEMLKIL